MSRTRPKTDLKHVWLKEPDGWIAICTILLFVIGLATFIGAKQTEKTQMRCYVGATKVELVHDPVEQTALEGDPGYVMENYIRVTLKNYGETPAFKVGGKHAIATFAYGRSPPDDFDYEKALMVDQEQVPRIRGKIDKVRITVDKDQESPILIPLLNGGADLFRRARAHELSVYLYGHIQSCDIYGRKWIREISFIYEPSKDAWGFVPFGPHQSEFRDGDC